MFVLPHLEAFKGAVQLLDEYKGDVTLDDLVHPDSGRCSPEDFLTTQLQKKECPDAIRQKISVLFFTIIKYRKFFDLVIQDYHASKSQRYPRVSKDNSLLLVFLYLAIVELEEATKSDIHDLLISLNDRKALSFFGYLKKSSMLTQLFEMGCTIWDVEYVKDVLGNVIDHCLFEEVYQGILDYAEAKKRSRLRQPTVPLDLQVLNRPKKPTREVSPKVFPSRIPVCVKPSQVPKTTYVKPIYDKKLEEIRERNRQEAKRLFEEAQKKQLSCANPGKSKKYVETIRKIQSERLNRPPKRKPSKIVKEEPDINPKTTATVVLREGARLMKLEQDEIKRYEQLASGAYDSNLLVEWEMELREQAVRQNLEDIARKHLQGLISYEEAVLAKQNYLKRTKEKAEEFRKEREVWLQQLEKWRKEEEMRIQENVEKGRAVGKGVKEAVEHCRMEKQKSALEVMEESRALKERILKEKEEDMGRKIEIIQEIKALQALSLLRPKQRELSETGNVGLLCEMSIAELRERLVILRLEVKQEVEDRREEFRRRRECRKEMLESYRDLIDNHRQVMKQIKETQDVGGKRKANVTSRSIEDLRKKLEEKRSERLKQKNFA